MTRKRKKALSTSDNGSLERPYKKTRLASGRASPSDLHHHPTLARYYAHIWTLRQYLLSRLPRSSKSKRRRLASAGLSELEGNELCDHSFAGKATLSRRTSSLSELNYHKSRLAKLLDGALVCENENSAGTSVEDRARDLDTFTQQVSMTAGSTVTQGLSPHSDIVDFAIWMLFNRVHRLAHRPPHMLCHGYQRAQAPNSTVEDYCAMAGIPGIVARYPNNNINVLKGSDWASVLSILGRDSERVMLDMLLDCGVFLPCSQGNGNYYQLSGASSLKNLNSTPD